MMRVLTLVLIMLFSVPSFADDTNIRFLERKKFQQSMQVNRMCIGGYEFAIICKASGEDYCTSHKGFDVDVTQIITEDGGGKKC